MISFGTGICISVNKGKCLTESDEFTRPKSGQVIGNFDELGLSFAVGFDIKIESAHKHFSNILFATSASSKTLGDADFNDLLKIRGDIMKDESFPEINRHPAMWVMPGNESDEKVGLMICGEYIQWSWDPNHPNHPKPVDRCWNHENVEAWKELSVGKW